MYKKLAFYAVAIILGISVAIVGNSVYYQDDLTILLNSLDNAKIYFFYSDGCPHCKEVKPYVQKIAEKYNITFCNVGSLHGDCSEVLTKMKLKYVPTLVFITTHKSYVFVGSNEVLEVINAIEGRK
ncbi:thioredoxin family protein [Archaeoglobus sp.]